MAHFAVPTLQIRLPLAVRIYVVLFTVVWCGLLASVVVRLFSRGSPTALIGLAMLALGAFLGYRLCRLGVHAEQDLLVVRNNLRTLRLTRTDIAGCRKGGTRGGFPGSQAVQLLLHDQALVPLDVTAAPLPLPWSRARLQQQLEQLQAWHSCHAD